MPLAIVFGLLLVACVKVDKMRLHHATICVLFGIALGVSLWGGEIWAVVVQLARWVGYAFTQAS